MKNLNLTGVTSDTWARLIFIILVIAMMILRRYIDGAELREYVETAIYATTLIFSFWKNNSFTFEAQSADRYMKTLKEERKF